MRSKRLLLAEVMPPRVGFNPQRGQLSRGFEVPLASWVGLSIRGPSEAAEPSRPEHAEPTPPARTPLPRTVPALYGRGVGGKEGPGGLLAMGSMAAQSHARCGWHVWFKLSISQRRKETEVGRRPEMSSGRATGQWQNRSQCSCPHVSLTGLGAMTSGRAARLLWVRRGTGCRGPRQRRR